jgi:LPS sulfotransferase NodH
MLLLNFLTNFNYQKSIVGLTKKVISPFYKEDVKKFIVFFRGRSGSSLLISLLDQHPLIKAEGEILSRNIFSPGVYLDLRASYFLGEYAVYGCKCKQGQLKKQKTVNSVEETLLSLSKRGFKIIYLKRENKLKQALSSIVATKRAKKKQGNFYRITQTDREKILYLSEKFTIEPKYLMGSTSYFERVGQEEDRIMSLIPHLEIIYERDLLKGEKHQSTIDTICEFLGIEKADCQSSNLVKANPDNIRDLVDNFSELIKTIQNSKYSHYLDEDTSIL